MGNTVGSRVPLTEKQLQVLTGTVLGDCNLYSTGKENAVIRFEHSLKQKDFLVWKASFFPELFKGKPTIMSRYNKQFGKAYEYIRWYSWTSPQVGEFKRLFYASDGKKVIPRNLINLLSTPLSLAVWYMDDGYYYAKDKMAYIYLPRFSDSEFNNMLNVLDKNFDLIPRLKEKKKGFCLSFTVGETRKLIELVTPHVIESMLYKVGL